MAESLAAFREEMLPGRTAVEVTDLLGKACESMKPGQLVHAETFTLLEALSAIEIGDQKVDIGVRADQGNSGVPSELFEVREGAMRSMGYEMGEKYNGFPLTCVISCWLLLLLLLLSLSLFLDSGR